MHRFLSLVFVSAAVMTCAPCVVAAAVEPLLVVVENRPGSGVDPVEVRRAIAAELRTLVRAPRDAAADDTSDLLIVAVDHAEIRMSLRGNAASVVSRIVPAPADRKARLQSIGWLAGNLARDQVSAVVASAPTPISASVPPNDAESASGAEVPPPPPPPATEPPPLAESAARKPAAISGGVAAQSAPAARGAGWSLTLGGGPSALWAGARDRDQPVWPGPGVWYLEVQRRAPPGSLILGASLEVGPDMALAASGLDFIGGAALVGFGHRFGRTFVEATAGLGLEAYQWIVRVQTTTTSSTGGEIQTLGVPTTSLGVFLRGQATAGVALSRSLDLLASVGGHLGTMGRWDHFLTSSLGLRVSFN